MERITAKEVTSMMQAVAQVYEQQDAEQIDENRRGEAARANREREERARIERDRLIQQAGGGVAGEKAATERLKDDPLRFLYDIESRGRADVRNKGREALRQLGDGDIELGLKRFREKQAAAAEKNTSGMSPAEVKAAQDAANQARRDGKLSDIRGGGGNVTKPADTKPADTKPQLTDQQKVRAEYDRLRKKDPKTGKVMGSPEDLKKAAAYGMAMSKAGAANKDFSGYKSAADLAKAKSDAKSNAGPGGYQISAGAKPITKAPISTTKPAATATSTSGPGGYQLSVDARPKSNVGRVASKLANSDAKPAAAVAATATNNYPGGKVGATGTAKPAATSAATPAAATPAAKPRAQVRGREAMMAAQRNRAAKPAPTPAVKAPATPAAKPVGSIADRLQQIRDMRARSQERIRQQGGTPATPAVTPTPKTASPSTTGATTTPTVKPAAKVEKKQPLKNGDPMERMTGKGAASLMETYSKVYEEREPQAIDEGIMGALKKVVKIGAAAGGAVAGGKALEKATSSKEPTRDEKDAADAKKHLDHYGKTGKMIRKEEKQLSMADTFLSIANAPKEDSEQLDEFLGPQAAKNVDALLKGGQKVLDKLGVPINRTPRPTVTKDQQQEKIKKNVK